MQLKMKQLLLVLLGVITVLFSSCKEESIAPVDVVIDTGLYPLAIGNTWIYQTDSIIFNKQLNSVDTLSGFVREKIIEEYLATGEVNTYVIERAFRRGTDSPWTTTDIFNATFIDNKATRSEENLRFVKLLFPVEVGQKWDGNQFFDESIKVNIGGEQIEVYKNWESKVTHIDSTVVIGNIEYANSTVVILADSENSIEKRFVEEIYAKDVGLISREMIILDTQNSDSTKPIIDRAEEGFVLSQSLIEYY